MSIPTKGKSRLPAEIQLGTRVIRSAPKKRPYKGSIVKDLFLTKDNTRLLAPNLTLHNDKELFEPTNQAIR